VIKVVAGDREKPRTHVMQLVTSTARRHRRRQTGVRGDRETGTRKDSRPRVEVLRPYGVIETGPDRPRGDAAGTLPPRHAR